MQARELIDLSAFLAAQGSLFLSGVRQMSSAALGQYWTISKCRLDRWNRSLRNVHTLPAPVPRRNSRGPARHLQGGVRGDFSQRNGDACVVKFADRLDYRIRSGDAQPVAANVLSGQLEASNRVLESSHTIR